MMRSTGKVFATVCLVVVGLLLLSQVPTFSVNGTQSRPVDLLGDLFQDNTKRSGDAVNGLMETGLTPVAEIPKEKDVAALPTVKADSLSDKDIITYAQKGCVMIEDFSEGKGGGMRHFYEKLSCEKDNHTPVRVAYFGDSFIEGDVLTCDLREMLQSEYGGSGPGWVDCGGGINSNRPTISVEYQDLTERVTTRKPFNNRLQCLNQRYYYAGLNASLHLGGTKFRPHVGRWDKATLFFVPDTLFSVEVNPGKTDYKENNFAPDSVVQALQTSMAMGNIDYRFHDAVHKTRLFGVALDGAGGVSLDNFSMRGTPGYTLTRIPIRTLMDIHRYRPYDLIILHFGLNVVNDSTTNAMCRRYINRMKKVVSNMRSAFPEAGIVVFSVPDRVQRGADGMHTLRGVEKMVGYQRQLASECGVAYLNLYQAMGGRESMKRYVDQGLAAKDYTHLNYKGGKVLAKHIFNSIQAGMEMYKKGL